MHAWKLNIVHLINENMVFTRYRLSLFLQRIILFHKLIILSYPGATGLYNDWNKILTLLKEGIILWFS
jgi:hypothetical protein